MKSVEIWDELGNTCFKTGVLDKAVDAYGKAIEQKSQSGWSYSNLAAIYVQQGRFSDAIPLYQKSLELFTSHKVQAVLWGRLGNVYHHLNEHGKAIQAYQKADKIVPSRTSAKIGLTLPQDKVFIQPQVDLPAGKGVQPDYQDWQDDPVLVDPLSDNEESLDTAMETIPSEPDIFTDDLSKVANGIEENANVWNELGLVFFKVGAYDDAIDAYQKAIELEPAFGWLYSNLGQVYATQGKLAEAVNFYEKSIQHLPTNKEKAVSWTRLAGIYRQLGQYDEAMAAYQLADALNQTVAAPINEYRQVNLSLIIMNPGQTRAMDDIDDLVVSIRVHGIIQPLIVCPGKNEPGKYLLIAGRRRLEAARRAGLMDVPVIVRRVNDQEILELSINENIHSAGIDPFELANGYRQMVNDFDLSIEEISARVGRSCHSVANTMKVLELPDDQGQALDRKPLGHDQASVFQSLAATPPVAPGLQNNPTNEPGTDQMEDAEFNVDAVKTSGNPKADASPELWYRETENESAATLLDDDYYPEATSLLARAHHVLMCNPHIKRLVTPSYQA